MSSSSGVVFDDREVVPGSLFCCLPGSRRDGHEFAGVAAAAGATAFICEHTLGAEVGDALQLVVPPGTARIAMARAACAYYGDPATALHTVGITGTNGKTTTTYLLRAILERAGWPTGSASGRSMGRARRPSRRICNGRSPKCAAPGLSRRRSR